MHKTCHRKKTEEDRSILMEYRNTRKQYLPDKLNTYSPEELKLATTQIITKLLELGVLDKYDKIIINKLKAVSKQIMKHN